MAFLVLPFAVPAENEQNKIVKLNNMVFKLKSEDTAITDIRLKSYIDIVNKIEAGIYKITGKLKKPAVLNETDSIKVTRDELQKNIALHERRVVMEFKNRKTGVKYIEFDNQNYPSWIDFPHDVSKSPKYEDLRKLREKEADLSKYPVIPESTAVKYAVSFLELLNGVEKTAIYDSIGVQVYAEADINMQYIVVFKAKVKNDICDARGAGVRINAFTGELVGYRGEPPFLNKEDFNYTPKISREQAIEIHAEACKKLPGIIKINSALLYKENINVTRWHWCINASNIRGEYGYPAILYIDSETGEIFYKTGNFK